jgi:hypothetical protein
MLLFIVKSSAHTDYDRCPVVYTDESLLPCQKLGVTLLKDDFMLKMFNRNQT